MLKYLALSLLLSLFFIGCSNEPVYNVYLAGDSTMADKKPEAYPETGWGQVFPEFFDTARVNFENHARNGRSSKSFRSEGLWDEMMANVVPGSYVFIQFGHNDERPSKGSDRYSTIPEFKENLRQYVREVRQHESFPILLTPIVRRKFDVDGHMINTHLDYPDATRSVAEEMNVLLIDLTNRSKEFVEAKGDSLSRNYYLWVEKGHENYPNGKQDDTHFSPEGAKVMAGMVVEKLKEENHVLENALNKN